MVPCPRAARPLTVALLIASAALAHAPPAAARTMGAAAKAFAEGEALYGKSEYREAIAAFERAHKLHPHYLITCNIARCHERLSDMVQAAEHYRRCLAEGGNASPQAAAIEHALATVESQLARLQIRVADGRPAQVLVDERPVGQAPLEVSVNPGTHVVALRRPGHRDASRTVQAEIGERQTVLFTLRPVNPRPPPPDPEPRDKPDVEVDEGGLSQLWFWLGVGVTVALATATAVMGARTLTANSDYEQDPTEPGYNTVLDRRLITNVFVGATAAAAAGTATLFFFTDFGGRAGAAPADERDDLALDGCRGRLPRGIGLGVRVGF